MHESEGVLAFTYQNFQLAVALKESKATINDEEMHIAMRNSLPERFDTLIKAFDAVRAGKTFTFEFLKSRLLQ